MHFDAKTGSLVVGEENIPLLFHERRVDVTAIERVSSTRPTIVTAKHETPSMGADDFELQSNGAAGIYRNNALYVRIESLFDLSPNNIPDDAVPGAAAVHIHEYVHYLHNVSTVAGQSYLIANLIFLRALAVGCDEGGFFIGEQAMPPSQKQLLAVATNTMRAQLGELRPQTIGWPSVEQCIFQSPRVRLVAGVPIAVTTVAVHPAGSERSGCEFNLGFSFVTEGVAYEVDREVRRLSGVAPSDLDAGIPGFPYLAYGAALNQWTGRGLTMDERILIGLAALRSPYPGEALVRICAEIRDRNETVQTLLERPATQMSETQVQVLARLRQLGATLANGGPVETGIAEYIKLAEAGARLRLDGPSPEFAFIERSLSAAAARELMGGMLDCLFIQNKPEGKAELAWIGPAHAAADDAVIASLASLQAALHFSQLHLTRLGSCVPTQLLPRTVECPFAGGCKVERDDGYPEVCRRAPWERFRGSAIGEPVCWYAAGVKTLGAPARTGADSKTPSPAQNPSDVGATRDPTGP